jgi:CDGSH-type Zn-finger protein
MFYVKKVQEELHMAEIRFMDNGPMYASGVKLIDGKGNEMEAKEKVALCRCGLSGNKPFCDGAHKGKFESAVRA